MRSIVNTKIINSIKIKPFIKNKINSIKLHKLLHYHTKDLNFLLTYILHNYLNQNLQHKKQISLTQSKLQINYYQFFNNSFETSNEISSLKLCGRQPSARTSTDMSSNHSLHQLKLLKNNHVYKNLTLNVHLLAIKTCNVKLHIKPTK